MNKLTKALALNDEVKVSIINATELTKEAIRRHNLWPSAASVFGKTMAMGLMMASSLKNKEALTIKINGNGPIGNIIVDITNRCYVRGYVDNPEVHFTYKNTIDEVTTIGVDGFIDVIYDLKIKDLHTSSVAIQTGNLAYDFAYYYEVSEQVRSAILLGSKFDVDNSCLGLGGVLIQLLPKASEKTILYLEKCLEKIENYSNLLHLSDIMVLEILFGQDFKVLEEYNCFFKCDCSKEKFHGGLLTLSKEDLIDMINVDKKANIVCRYCNNDYEYNIDDLNLVLKQKEKNNA